MNLSEINGIMPSKRTFKPSSDFVDPFCPVGIEIEAEQVPSSAVRRVSQEFWDVKDDGSLRNDGKEFASHSPVFGEDINLALDNVEDALNGAAQITWRCGLHIHIDVSSLTTQQLLSFTCAYLIAEDALFKYVGEYRKNSIYCLPLSHTEGLIKYYANLKNGDKSSIYRGISQTQKYNAFNVLPILSQGSVEFRHHPGTWNKEVIKKWVNIIMQLRNVGIAMEATSLVNLPYYKIADVVFGEFKDELCPSGDIDLAGWMMAKDMLNFSDISRLKSKLISVYRNDAILKYKGNK